jgi:hypothetical protein
MSNQNNTEILENIDDIMARASDAAEMWTGTMTEKIIDTQQARVIRAVAAHDLEAACELAYDLDQTVTQAFADYDR